MKSKVSKVVVLFSIWLMLFILERLDEHYQNCSWFPIAFATLIIILYAVYFSVFIADLKRWRNGEMQTMSKVLFVFYGVILIVGAVLMLVLFLFPQ